MNRRGGAAFVKFRLTVEQIDLIHIERRKAFGAFLLYNVVQQAQGVFGATAGVEQFFGYDARKLRRKRGGEYGQRGKRPRGISRSYFIVPDIRLSYNNVICQKRTQKTADDASAVFY